MFYIIYKETRKELLFVCLAFYYDSRVNLISASTRTTALFACSLLLRQQILITVPKKPVFVCKDTNTTFPVLQSQVALLPCAQMSVRSFRLVRQLPGDQQEAVRATNKHTLVHTRWLDPSCPKHDTSEDANPTPREYEKLWDLLFLLFDIIARMTLYEYAPFFFLLGLQQPARC